MRVENKGLLSPLIAKLSRFDALSESDREMLRELETSSLRTVEAREDIISEGDPPTYVNLVLSGWAYRYKQLEDGQRQIFAYLLPGDLNDLKVFTLRKMDHSIAAIARTVVADIPREIITSLTDSGSRVANALWRSSLVAQAIEREWIVNIGQRNAFQRVCHLLCELLVRLDLVGLTNDMSFVCPLTQTELADSTGLSAVHINRTLNELRVQGLIGIKGRIFTIQDWDRLKRLAAFTPNYLHLDKDDHERNGASDVD